MFAADMVAAGFGPVEIENCLVVLPIVVGFGAATMVKHLIVLLYGAW